MLTLYGVTTSVMGQSMAEGCPEILFGLGLRDGSWRGTVSWQPFVKLILLQLLLAAVSLPPTTSATRSPDDRALMDHCKRFRAFEEGIAEDLLPWYDDTGISEQLMDRTLQMRTMKNGIAGLPLCIRGGKLYVIEGTAHVISRVFRWYADEIVTYAYVSGGDACPISPSRHEPPGRDRDGQDRAPS